MRPLTRAGTLLAIIYLSVGCYNARVNTGLTPSDEVIAEEWAASWIYGAVSPKTVEVASQCPNGVAQVHTYHSFLNIVVASLTFGIFTPMTIKVTCARGGMSDAGATEPAVHVDKDAPIDQQVEQFQRAVDRATESGNRILIRF